MRTGLALFTAACAATALLPVPAAAAASPDVVLAEVYGGGGNTGATHTHDFVELHYRGAAAVSIGGWSVQYASAAGTTWLVTPLTGSVAAGGRYPVRLATGGATWAALPAPDATGTTNMSATAALGCGANCDTAPGVRATSSATGPRTTTRARPRSRRATRCRRRASIRRPTPTTTRTTSPAPRRPDPRDPSTYPR